MVDCKEAQISCKLSSTKSEDCLLMKFLKLVLSIYFLPYNLLRLIRYLRIRHDYKKNEIEMVVLTKKLKDNRNGRTYGDK